MHQLCQSLRGKRGGGETFAEIFVVYPLIRWQQLLAIKMYHSLLGIHVVNVEMDSVQIRCFLLKVRALEKLSPLHHE